MAKQKYKFERLTPIDNMDLDVYEEAIDYVFSNSDVKNVAISGAYSAGKSSVLASYKKKHDELRFLHISLAHFKSTDQESDAEVKESTLEGKILNQLIHQIPSEKIPQTNFRVKKTVSSKSIATSTIGAVLFLISILHLLFFSVWKNYIGVLPVSLIKSILMPSTHPYALIVDGIIILVLLSLSVYKLIRIQREKNIFRKLNIKGNEIEIFEKSDDSYFDKYLNEVLYLFENSDADVIVFEDMDRFNTNVDTVGKTLFSQNELVEILTWDINDDLKISLLKMSKEPISIIGKGYSTAVCLHILSNNFAESDLPSLFSSFEQWDDSIQEKIFDHAVNNISCIIDNQDSIPTKLIKSLLNSESVSRDEKLDLFAAIMPGLCVDDIQSILILLNLTDYLKIFDMRSRPKFEINNESEKLLAAFKECHLIDSYEESTTKAGYYKVARPKATKALSKEPSTVT